MATFSKLLLSGSTDGRGIKVAATSSPGTLIHTAVTGSSSLDEVWLYSYNSDTVSRLLTIQFGGTTSPDDDIKGNIPPQSGLVLIVAGLLLQNGDLVKAYAATTNVVTILGWVNRIV